MKKLSISIFLLSIFMFSKLDVVKAEEMFKYYTKHIGIKIGKAMDIENGSSTSSLNRTYDLSRYPSLLSIFYNYRSKKGGKFEMELGMKTGSDGYYSVSEDRTIEYIYASYNIKNSMVTFDIAGGYKIIGVGLKFLFRGTPTFENRDSGATMKEEDFSETDVIVYVGIGGLINLNITDDNKYGLALKGKIGYPLTPGYGEIRFMEWTGYYLEVEAGIGIGI